MNEAGIVSPLGFSQGFAEQDMKYKGKCLYKLAGDTHILHMKPVS